MEIKSTDMPYYIIIKLENEKLILEGESIGKFPTEEYSINYTLDELKQSNKFFASFDKMQQVYDEIKYSKKNEKLQLLKESENLILRLPLDLSNYKEILFTLKKKEINLKRAILDLNSNLNSIKDKDICELSFSTIKLKNELKFEIKSLIEELKKENLSQNAEIKSLIEELKKENLSQNAEIKYLNDKLKKSNDIINEKGKKIEELDNELYYFETSKNKEIKNLKNEVNDLKKKLDELEKKNNDMENNFKKELKKNMMKLKKRLMV